jgi:hypothetical protein
MGATRVCRTYFAVLEQGYHPRGEWFGYGVQCDECQRILVISGAADTPEAAISAARLFGFDETAPQRMRCIPCRLDPGRRERRSD